jgi:hypothetical protein
MAVITQRLDTVRWLVAHGADPSRTDQIHNGTPVGWAEHNLRDSEVHRFLAGLPMPPT